MMKKFKTVDDFLNDDPLWREGLDELRAILLATELEETVKWSMPVYTLNNKNVAGIGRFKAYFGIWFYQGVFLEDPAGVLLNAQKDKTKGLRQWRFTSVAEIDAPLVKVYLEEAIQNQKEGKMIQAAKPKQALVLPDELTQFLVENEALYAAFQSFTKGKQREFVEYINEAKQAATKARRMEKIRPMILRGEGLNDRYK